jgi:hypothetical protein
MAHFTLQLLPLAQLYSESDDIEKMDEDEK